MNKGSQCFSILQRLQKGRASNIQLSRLSGAKSLTRRISDLREIGYNITCVGKDNQRGITWYELNSKGEPLMKIKKTRVKCSSRLCKFNKKSHCIKSTIEIQANGGIPMCMEYIPVVRKKNNKF